MISSFHRPTVARVNLQAIKENVASVQKHIPLGVKTYAVVKADAYGHGAVQVSKALLPQVDGYCVSNLDEALQLRQAGIDKEILILGVLLPNELELAVANAITVTIASLDWIALARLEKKECQGLKVHVKVDSGMGRIGLRSSKEVNLLIDSLKELGADVEGIFTHFATADEADDTKFNQQLQFFKKLIAGLEDKPRLVHASNSATSIWHSDTIFNAVRLGIVSYGLNPSGSDLSLPFPLQEALSLESSLVHVKMISAGDTVGYGATYTAKKSEYVGLSQSVMQMAGPGTCKAFRC